MYVCDGVLVLVSQAANEPPQSFFPYLLRPAHETDPITRGPLFCFCVPCVHCLVVQKQEAIEPMMSVIEQVCTLIDTTDDVFSFKVCIHITCRFARERPNDRASRKRFFPVGLRCGRCVGVGKIPTKKIQALF